MLHNKSAGKQYLGRLEGRSCYAGELLPDTAAPEGLSFYGLRQFLGQAGEDLFVLASKAYQLLYWDRTHQYCSRCGAKTEDKVMKEPSFVRPVGLLITQGFLQPLS